MQKENKILIGNWEAIWLLINAICAKVYLGFPRETMEVAGTAGWIMDIYISILALVGFVIISKLYKRFEGKDLLDIGEHLGGSVGRIVVGLILLSFLLYIVPTVLRIFTEDMKIISFPASPISFVMLFFMIGMMSAAYSGIQNIARMAGIAVTVIAGAYIIVLIMVIPYYDITNIFPILGKGADSIFIKGTLKVSAFSELIYLFMLAPFLKDYKGFKTVGYWTVLGSGCFFVIGTLILLATYFYPSGLERVLPIYQISRLVYLGRFFQRVESLFLISWAFAGLIYISNGFFFIIYVFRKMFKLNYHRPLIMPFAVLVFTLSLLPQGLMSTLRFEASFFRNWSWIVTFGMTIILLLIARFVIKPKKKDISE